MSYTKHTWQTGETITAENLNNMQSGIENATKVTVIGTYNDPNPYQVTLTKTWGEIYDLFSSGVEVNIRFEVPNLYTQDYVDICDLKVTKVWIGDSDGLTYNIYTDGDSNQLHKIFGTWSPDEYPIG